MEENTEEETLENKINVESENLSDKIIAPFEANIVTPKQETENI